MWLAFAFGSALFAGLTSILAKIGIQHTDSNVATAIRTVVVLIFSWLMAAISGSLSELSAIQPKTLIFLILSGLSTGASWLFYFKALQKGNVNKVAAVDKSGIVLTILLSFIFFHEEITFGKLIGLAGITLGTYLMLEPKKEVSKTEHSSWFLYAVLSVIFASLTTILGKIGIHEIESNLGTAIRTNVVLVMAWIVVFVTKKQDSIHTISRKELFFLGLSGLATGASWLCYYKALQDGQASLVVPIDKLSILVTVAFSVVVLHEKLSKKAVFGLGVLTIGTLLMLV